jgi:uncharacterized protein involved in response to NO
MSDASTRSRSAASANDVWIPFFWAAIAFAVVPGFALGGLLFVVPAAGRSVGTWWLAAARVHGHVQLVGWAGLMVLGVGLYFLPRLRGRPLDHPGQARAVLALLVSGLVLRMLTEPLLAASGAAILRAGLVVSGVLELAGVSAAIALLARTMRGDPPVRARAGLLQVLPFLVTAFLGF